MQVHFPTLFLVIIVAGAALAAAMAFVAYGRDRRVMLVALALGLHTVAYALYALRGQISDVVSIVLANMALAATFSLLTEAVLQFQQRRFVRWLVWLPVALACLIFSVLLENARMRVLFGVLVFALQALFIVWLLLDRRQHTNGRGQYLLAVGAGLAATAFIFHFVSTVFFDVEALKVSAPSPLQSANFLMAILVLMLLAVGLVVMIKEQADEVARKSQDFVQGILDSVSNQIAVLDAHGNIIAINNAWHQFAIDNSAELGQPAPQTAVGTNYLEICGMDAEVGAVAASDEAMSARDGIQAVLAGSLPSFSLEYPCHSPHEYRWFVMTVTPLRSGEKGAVVVHGNITRRKQAEHYEQIRSQALELLSENAPLERVLHVFVQGVEGFNPEMQCTIVLADPSALTAPQRVSASWSKPILAANGQPLGMFHIYHRQPTAPAQAEMAWVERFARLASIAIERSTTAQKLRASEAHFRLLTEDVSDVVWKMGADFHFTYISPADEHLRGFPASEVIGHHVFELLTDEGIAAINAAMRQRDLAEQQGPVLGPTRFEVQQRCRDGTLVWTEILSTKEIDDSGKVIGYHGITRNIAEHKATQEQVRQLAFYDVLTNLANRRLFADRLNQTIVRAQREQSRCGLLFIDLDKFKPVNDQYGHAVGDWLLQAVARRIESCLRASDTAARMGGDEFVVLLPDLQTPNDGLAVAEKIRASLLQPLLSPQGIDLGASASIGVALYPDHASTEQELLRLGDDAMYRAKKLGGNTVEWCAYASEAQGGDGMDNAAQSIVRLVWKAAFASGNAVIDREHRELFRLANVLLGHAMARLEQPEAFNAAFDTLLAHVVAHFADEEEILRRLNYGDLQEHTQLHRSLVEQAQALRQTATLEQTTVAALVDFLVTHVVAGHMLREDRKFFPLLAGEITSS